ncbi:hypothetical protein ASPFODRAFT_441395 [Aspergillus luchuensis CBS 106.47]|uniref:Transmembrane protein n=1 Tax=Aspergillus luchuensis (strain CBS 106.47) TaxID=1137211 RepID=A0A1M3TWG3_ASPLC|nr:hypothetical protein ASPFODRAFT_441395 [Aspergillus luchuensis CBS 106.47]
MYASGCKGSQTVQTRANPINQSFTSLSRSSPPTLPLPLRLCPSVLLLLVLLTFTPRFFDLPSSSSLGLFFSSLFLSSCPVSFDLLFFSTRFSSPSTCCPPSARVWLMGVSLGL